ncbi:glucan endo-1,6-beta-glucosidase [Galbibacter sp. BG1]|uniref:glycoside hydrolase family 30 protein n=1 Tax=Galbibacter sp. BG1 TaxID=1170699 RepID=UPI0015BA721D|nr:glycoside hydrolase family 30 beta sandwich domain-containing protein [Galbibacter sp. BG1]QLE01268.1 glucan endo-1,6-beta-glucosidase [Galbibacter sp. BG1]
MKERKLVYIIFLTLLMFSCGDDSTMEEEKPDPPKIEGTVSVVLTTVDQSSLLKEIPEKLPVMTGNSESGLVIDLDESQTAQTIEGFGAALTGSSAYLLHNNDSALEMLFGDSGIKLGYVRLTMGASDFNKNKSYSYNETTEVEDLDLDNFSIEEDKINDNPLIPVAKAILAKNAAIKFMSSPWTAPTWMKNNRAFNGGNLKTEYRDVYADYFVKYLNAYKSEGININSLTVQNEPLYETSSYPTMKMSAMQQADFIGDFLGPKLKASGLNTKIIAYDHNFTESEDPDYPLTVLGDVQASKHTNAVAYHAYGGKPEDIARLTNAFPDSEIYFTEQSGIETDQTTFKGEIDYFMKNVFAGTLRRGAKAVLLWNLALNENNGPQNGGCDICTGVLKITSGGTITKNPEYYILGHFSKYVNPGAKVIPTNALPGIIENVGFVNPDGSKVVVAYNASGASGSQKIAVKTSDGFFEYNLPQGGLVTFKWD